MSVKSKINMDDGFNPEFVETAIFDGILEIPCIEKQELSIIPPKAIPINELNKSEDHSELVIPYVYDSDFGDIVRNPQKYVNILSAYPAITSLDNSVYVDSPLTVQIANVYRSRSIGHFFQAKGLTVIPNVRWGDERSYTSSVLPEPFAFLGLPKHSILCIGTYGACKTNEEKYHLRHGLIEMLDRLSPETVLVYGAMPDSVFHGLYNKTQFIQYPDWMSSRKRRAC